MKYIIVWGILNYHTGAMRGPYADTPYREYTALECTQAVMKKQIEIPKGDEVKVYQCVEKPKPPEEV